VSCQHSVPACFLVILCITLQFCVWPDGMLIMRARPPPAQDFISIFQKFKLAINLLVSGFYSVQPRCTFCLIGLVIVFNFTALIGRQEEHL